MRRIGMQLRTYFARHMAEESELQKLVCIAKKKKQTNSRCTDVKERVITTSRAQNEVCSR